MKRMILILAIFLFSFTGVLAQDDLLSYEDPFGNFQIAVPEGQWSDFSTETIGAVASREMGVAVLFATVEAETIDEAVATILEELSFEDELITATAQDEVMTVERNDLTWETQVYTLDAVLLLGLSMSSEGVFFYGIGEGSDVAVFALMQDEVIHLFMTAFVNLADANGPIEMERDIEQLNIVTQAVHDSFAMLEGDVADETSDVDAFGSLVGTLQDIGAPIADRSLVLCRVLEEGDEPFPADCELVDYTATSDEDGNFVIEEVPVGTYFILYDAVDANTFQVGLEQWLGETLQLGNGEWLINEYIDMEAVGDDFSISLTFGVPLSSLSASLIQHLGYILSLETSPFLLAHDIEAAAADSSYPILPVVAVIEADTETLVEFPVSLYQPSLSMDASSVTGFFADE